MMSAKIDLQAASLIYIAEGNANIVLKLPEHGKVLRLPKSIKGSQQQTDPELYSYLQRSQHYMKILQHFLGTNYVLVPTIIEITRNERNRINEFLETDCRRPENRLEKDFNGKYALLMDDATAPAAAGCCNEQRQTTYAVEIKPKQGWNYDANSTESLFGLKGLKKCRYCCMQYLKMKKGKIKTRSKYCPMDLFSGHPDKMHFAIKGLLDSPQNNLRIFKNGRLVYGEKVCDAKFLHELFDKLGGEGEFYNILVNSLLREHSSKESEVDGLNNQNILETILELQRLTKNNLLYMSALPVNDIKTYKSLESLVQRTDPICLDDLTPEEQYMIGATLLDASVMVTFHHCSANRSAEHNGTVQVSDKTYSIKVNLLDLDPKPDNHFQKYKKQTNEAYDVACKELSLIDKTT